MAYDLYLSSEVSNVMSLNLFIIQVKDKIEIN